MSCHSDCFEVTNQAADRYAVAEGVRLRPVPEAGACLAYTRARPALHRLNVTGWLLVSLCDGRPLRAVAADYRAALGVTGQDDATLRQALEQLVALGVLRRVSTGKDEGGNDAGQS